MGWSVECPQRLIRIIIAAKTFARYKELEKRESAEYVLVGTLLSILCAVLIGLAIRLFVEKSLS
jgi:hypothetical protein